MTARTVTRWTDCCTGHTCPNHPGHGWYHHRQPDCTGPPLTAPITTDLYGQLALELT